jgi:hypothetical protein
MPAQSTCVIKNARIVIVITKKKATTTMYVRRQGQRKSIFFFQRQPGVNFCGSKPLWQPLYRDLELEQIYYFPLFLQQARGPSHLPCANTIMAITLLRKNGDSENRSWKCDGRETVTDHAGRLEKESVYISCFCLATAVNVILVDELFYPSPGCHTCGIGGIIII